MLMLRQSVAFVNQKLFRFREDVFIAGDRAQLFDEAVVLFQWCNTGSHYLDSGGSFFNGGERDDTLRRRLAGSAGRKRLCRPMCGKASPFRRLSLKNYRGYASVENEGIASEDQQVCASRKGLAFPHIW